MESFEKVSNVYYDFGFADFVSVAIECNVCHTRSPEFKNFAEMVEWVDQHEEDCDAHL